REPRIRRATAEAKRPYARTIHRVYDSVGALVPQPVHRVSRVLREATAARRSLEFIDLLVSGFRKREFRNAHKFTKALDVRLRIGGKILVPGHADVRAPERIEPSRQVRGIAVATIDMRPRL